MVPSLAVYIRRGSGGCGRPIFAQPQECGQRSENRQPSPFSVCGYPGRRGSDCRHFGRAYHGSGPFRLADFVDLEANHLIAAMFGNVRQCSAPGGGSSLPAPIWACRPPYWLPHAFRKGQDESPPAPESARRVAPPHELGAMLTVRGARRVRYTRAALSAAM